MDAIQVTEKANRRQVFAWLRTLFLLACVHACFAPNMAAETAARPLQPNDSITMMVYGEDTLTTRTKVLVSGEVVLPLLGSVKVGGLTVAQATALVRELYNKDLLVEPRVTITVDSYAQEFVTVSGAVNAPGPVVIPAGGKLDLSTALISCGGLSPRADPQKIMLIRSSGESQVFTEAVLKQAGAVPLRSGDKVVVNDSEYVAKTVIVQGKVNRQGQVSFPVNGQLDVFTAITLAGGFHELANPRRVEVNRKGKVTILNVREMSEKGSARFALQPDDIITVPERWF